MGDIRIWRTVTRIISQAGMGRVSGFEPLIVDTGTLERLIVGEASEGFLETYGVTPILGRAIQADDTRTGAPGVALLGHSYWQRQFGGDRSVLGRGIANRRTPEPPNRRRHQCAAHPERGRDRASRRAKGCP